jgi:hypothetical protein
VPKKQTGVYYLLGFFIASRSTEASGWGFSQDGGTEAPRARSEPRSGAFFSDATDRKRKTGSDDHLSLLHLMTGWQTE